MINLKDLKQFHEHQYARHLVLRTPNMEIIVVCWLPGQASPVHGHGPSDAVMVQLEGEITYTNFYPDGKKVSGVLHAGDIDHTPVGVEHQIANHSNDACVTLNIYSPPLQKEFQGFDLGYANDVKLEEIQLSDDVVRYLRAASPLANTEVNYTI